MTEVKLSIAWDAYKKNICNGLSLLQQRGEFVDMTIAADGYHVKVHQLVLSLVSPYIKDLIASAQSSHPVIFLNRVSHQTLLSILEYAYTGEVMIARESFCEFLEACNSLHIRGLESDSIKTAQNEHLLNILGVRSVQNEDSIQTSQTINIEKSQSQQGFKTIKIDTIEENHELYEETTYLIDESQMEDSDADDNEDTKEKVLSNRLDTSQSEANVLNTRTNSVIQYSLSCQGSIQLVLNRYIYCMRHTRKNNERMWRCTDYNKSQCRAYAVTRGDVVLERGCAHNHPFHDERVLKKVRNGNLYAAYNAVKGLALMSKKERPGQDTINKDDDDTL